MVKRKARESAEPLPPKRRSELTDAALDLEAIARNEQQVIKLAQEMQSRPMNQQAVLKHANAIEKLLLINQALMLQVWFKLSDIGADIQPDYPSSPYHQS